MQNKYTILLLGGTGQGKTSFLNLLLNGNTVLKGVNSINSVNQQNKIDIEQNLEDEMASKTDDALVYKNVPFGNFKINIIDTPGFGDSRGLK